MLFAYSDKLLQEDDSSRVDRSIKLVNKSTVVPIDPFFSCVSISSLLQKNDKCISEPCRYNAKNTQNKCAGTVYKNGKQQVLSLLTQFYVEFVICEIHNVNTLNTPSAAVLIRKLFDLVR